MTITRSDRQERYRRALPTRVVCRWNREPQAESDDDPKFKALCGHPGCGGLLGQLLYVTDGVLTNAEYWEHAADPFIAYAREEWIDKGLPVPEKLASILDRFLIVVNSQAEAMREFERIAIEEGDVLGQLDGWYLRPIARKPRHGTTAAKRPQPIYIGFDDTGYEISFDGKRNENGQRVGRRPSGPSRSKAIVALSKDPEGWIATGQILLPPCEIFFPNRNCERLNFICIPDGFVIHDVEIDLP